MHEKIHGQTDVHRYAPTVAPMCRMPQKQKQTMTVICKNRCNLNFQRLRDMKLILKMISMFDFVVVVIDVVFVFQIGPSPSWWAEHANV